MPTIPVLSHLSCQVGLEGWQELRVLRAPWDVWTNSAQVGCGAQKLCHLNLITGTAPPSKCWKWDRLSKENENKKISDTRTHTEICHSIYAYLRYDRFPSIIYSTQTYIILPLRFAPNHYPNINESPEARCSVSSRKKCCVDWWYAQITSQKNAHICLPIWRFPKKVVPLNHPL